jgi:hypothetical protein
MVKVFTLEINAGVYVPGVQVRDQPCNQPLGGMTNKIGDQTILGRVSQKRGLGSRRCFFNFNSKQQKKHGQLERTQTFGTLGIPQPGTTMLRYPPPT